ncbi:MAG TPA: DUF3618 domain-containing protein [Thermomicrobiales bacterium]|nr:DUF3618 domain-containing protein [Thermomicrobiales bacterium]
MITTTAPAEDEVQQTREDISETLDAIQEKLAPSRLTDDARDAAVETVDHVVAEARATAQEWSEMASVAAMEAVEHALKKIREAFPDLSQQAQHTARETVDHAMAEARSSATEAVDHALVKAREALPDLTAQAQEAARQAVDHAIAEARLAFPDLTQQAQEAAREAVDHAISEAKQAIRELGDQTRAAVRNATIGKVERMATTTSETSKSFSSTTVQTIKQNPGPAALAALGLGWLVMNGRSSAKNQSSTSVASGTSNSGSLGDGVQNKLGQAQAASGEAVDKVTDTVADASGKVTDALGTASDKMTNSATVAAGQVQETAIQATNKAKQVPTRLRESIAKNPIPMGLVAAALGTAAAFAVPETRRENALLGETRDNLVGQAQATAQTTIEKVQRVAEAVGDTVEKEAKYEGLSDGDK